MAVIEIRRWRSARSSRVGTEMRSLARLGISCSVGSPLGWTMCRPMSMSVEFKGEVKISERPAKLAENPTMFRSQSVCRDKRQRERLGLLVQSSCLIFFAVVVISSRKLGDKLWAWMSISSERSKRLFAWEPNPKVRTTSRKCLSTQKEVNDTFLRIMLSS